MRTIEIKTIKELYDLDLSLFQVNEDIDISIKLRVDNERINYPIKIIHSKPRLKSNIYIKLALFGSAHIHMPVEILVEKGAYDTSTNFKALVYILSEKAHAGIIPGLFIHEKNIQNAGHGVVIKNIKDKDLIYLRSRGIPVVEAKEKIIAITYN